MINKVTFGKLSFENDKNNGLYARTDTWDTISQTERDDYLEEAEYYLSRPKDEWPTDILERI